MQKRIISSDELIEVARVPLISRVETILIEQTGSFRQFKREHRQHGIWKHRRPGMRRYDRSYRGSSIEGQKGK